MTDLTAQEVAEAIPVLDLTVIIAGYIDELAEPCGLCDKEAWRAAGPTCRCHHLFRKCESCFFYFFHSHWTWGMSTSTVKTRLANGKTVKIEETVATLRHNDRSRPKNDNTSTKSRYEYSNHCPRYLEDPTDPPAYA